MFLTPDAPIRHAYPMGGKAKIAVVIKREHGYDISESMALRILSFLSQKRLITRARSRPQRRRRDFSKGHAQAWKYKEYKDIELGERVQIDHMSATKGGVGVKHFMAQDRMADRKSKHIHAQIYSNAKATSAQKFLRELVQTAPYDIRSIQVDGGSEFMAEFENECAALEIPLIVLPPSKPTYNGGIERANRTFREDFYDDPKILLGSIGALRFELKKAVQTYNEYRPHSALQGRTPIEYLRISQTKAA